MKAKANPWIKFLMLGFSLGVMILVSSLSPVLGEGKTLYHCPMHPQIIADKPGQCPICHMDLQKVEGDEKIPQGGNYGMEGRAAFSLSQERQQLIGVTSTLVEKKSLIHEIRSNGRVAFDPDLYTAIEEYRLIKDQSPALLQSSKTKLKLMGLSEDQIRELSKSSQNSLDLLLPKGNVWVYAEVFEYEMTGLRPGALLEVESPFFPGKTFLGHVASISPVVNTPSRTIRLRGTVPDPGGILRPDTFLNVTIKVDFGKKLVIPEDSVLYSGEKKYVFILKENGRFESRPIQTGVLTREFYEILSGLQEGERVVTGANFLIDSESRLRSVLEKGHD